MIKKRNISHLLFFICLSLFNVNLICSEKTDKHEKDKLDVKRPNPITTSPATASPNQSSAGTPRLGLSSHARPAGAGITVDLGHPSINVTGTPSVQFSMKDNVPLKVSGTGDPKDAIHVEPNMSRETGLRLAGIIMAGGGAPCAAAAGYSCYLGCSGCAVCSTGLFVIAKPKETAEYIHLCHETAVTNIKYAYTRLKNWWRPQSPHEQLKYQPSRFDDRRD